MRQPKPTLSRTRTAFGLAELIYFSVVRHVRKTHRNAIIGLLSNVFQMVLMVMVFFLMFQILGVRRPGIHQADLLLFLMTGILLLVAHTKTMMAVANAEGPTSEMMFHLPLNTLVTMSAAALGNLYIQVLSIIVVLFLYHAIFTPVTIDEPFGAMGMFILAWFSGACLGVALFALKPWTPQLSGLIGTIYSRLNIIASGKMFVVNHLPGVMIAMFVWNPLFHIIDQCRGFVFRNYDPDHTTVAYPIILSIVFLVIGMLGDSFTRRHASASWSAGR